MIPNESFVLKTGSTPGGARITGSELYDFGAALNGGGLTPVQYKENISPLYCIRLKNMAVTYDHYKFHYARFTFIPAVPYTFSGALAIGVDYDVDDNPPTTLGDVMACRAAAMGPVYSQLDTELLGSLSTYGKYFCKDTTFTGVDNPQKFQGALKIYIPPLFDPLGVQYLGVVGYIMLTYDIEFYSPGTA